MPRRLFLGTVLLLCMGCHRAMTACGLATNAPLHAAIQFREKVAPRSLHVVALDAQSGATLRFVQVLLPDLHVGTSSDTTGRVVILDLPVGSHRVYVRSLGYERRVDTLEVQADAGLAVLYQLRRYSVCLERVVPAPGSGTSTSAP